MARRPLDQTDTVVTATGWKIVGSAAQSLSAAASAEVFAPTDEDILYAANFRVRPRLGTDVAGALIDALNGVVRTVPPLGRDRAHTEPTGRFNGLRWDVVTSGDQWLGELVMRHAHPAVNGVACTTHVVVGDNAGHVTMTVRVGAPGGVRGVYGLVGVGQARPAFLADMDSSARLVFFGEGPEPRVVSEQRVDEFVDNVLYSETREHPIAVLSPTETNEYLVSPRVIAAELLGLAHVYVLEKHPATFRLTDALGDRRMSCYWGAMHVYMPDFSVDDRLEDHPLLVADRLTDPVMRAELVGRLAQFVRPSVPMPLGVAAMREALRPARPPAAAASVAAPIPPAAAPTEVGSAPAVAATTPPFDPEVLRTISSQLQRLVEVQEATLDELVRLRTTTAIRSANTASVERRIGHFEEMLRASLAPAVDAADQSPEPAVRPAEPIEDPEDEGEPLVSILRQAAESHRDALWVLDSAERSAMDSPYEDVPRVAAVLEGMAMVARRRQAGTLAMSIKEAFREMGVDYRGGISAATPKALKQQYVASLPGGEDVLCEEHIVLGKSYDPRYCLRIYFTSRAAGQPRFVISHVGRHHEVQTTT